MPFERAISRRARAALAPRSHAGALAPGTRARARFLEALRRTAMTSDAADAAGVSTDTCYRQRKNDEAFRREWDEAKREGIDLLVDDEVLRRSVVGDEELVVQGGRVVERDGQPVTRTVRSERLAELLYKQHHGLFGNGVNVEVNVNGGTVIPLDMNVFSRLPQADQDDFWRITRAYRDLLDGREIVDVTPERVDG
jgi:hypothetical protein